MRGYVCVLWVLSCWAPGAFAGPAASAVTAAAPNVAAASAVKAAKSPDENYRLGMKFKEEDSLTEAVYYFMRAAEQGHAAAQAEVADLLEAGSAWDVALKWWRKSAEQGYVPGQFGLAKTLSTAGRTGIKQDDVEARKWFDLAAKQGHVGAIHEMAHAYMVGGLGLGAETRYSPEALAAIKRAADIDAVYALKELSDAYRTGKYGLAADPAQADTLDAKIRELTAVKEVKKKKQR